MPADLGEIPKRSSHGSHGLSRPEMGGKGTGGVRHTVADRDAAEDVAGPVGVEQIAHAAQQSASTQKVTAACGYIMARPTDSPTAAEVWFDGKLSR